MEVYGVAKTTNNSGKRRSKTTKKCVRTLYFYDSFGKFHTKRVSFLESIYYKHLVRHSKVFHCKGCGSKVIGSCPNCI